MKAHHSNPLKARLSATQTMDQRMASGTETSCAPCFLRTTKSTKRASKTKMTKTNQSHSGASVFMRVLRKKTNDQTRHASRTKHALLCVERSCGRFLCGPRAMPVKAGPC